MKDAASGQGRAVSTAEVEPDAVMDPLAMAAGLAAAEGLARQSMAPATLRAYRADWTHFSRWCAQVGLSPIPAAPTTIRRRHAAISQMHRFNYLPFSASHAVIRTTWQGLLCAVDGCPVAVEVFEGNTANPATVVAQVAKLQQRFRLRHVVLVGDRGMLTAARIERTLRPAGLDWITALRSPAIRQLAEAGALQFSLFDTRDMAEIAGPDYPDERLVVCKEPSSEGQDAPAGEFMHQRRARRLRDEWHGLRKSEAMATTAVEAGSRNRLLLHYRSGATRQTSRFSERVLLRRSHPENCLFGSPGSRRACLNADFTSAPAQAGFAQSA